MFIYFSHPKIFLKLYFSAEIGKAMYKMLVVRAFRPDRLIASTHLFVNAVMGQTFTQHAEQELDLGGIIENEVKCTTPILMCSVPGYDASGRVDDLATELNKPITSIAIGMSPYGSSWLL